MYIWAYSSIGQSYGLINRRFLVQVQVGPLNLKKEKEMIVEKLKEIVEELACLEEDAQKSENGNASAGRRVRKVSI